MPRDLDLSSKKSVFFETVAPLQKPKTRFGPADLVSVERMTEQREGAVRENTLRPRRPKVGIVSIMPEEGGQQWPAPTWSPAFHASEAEQTAIPQANFVTHSV